MGTQMFAWVQCIATGTLTVDLRCHPNFQDADPGEMKMDTIVKGHERSTDDFAAMHKMTSTYPAFEFRVDPVLDIKDAVAAQLEAMAWLDSIPSV
jgi:hypothetical protein